MTTRSKIAVIISLILVLSCKSIPGNTQEFPEELSTSLKEFLDDRFSNLQLKGGAATVILPDGSQWNEVTGISSAGVPVDTSRVFFFASLTKTFTATVILMLAEEGKLNLSDTLGSYVSGIEKVDGATSITELLHHTGQISDFKNYPGFWDTIAAYPERIYTPEEVMDRFLSSPVNPDKKFWYNNTNYILLGLIIKAVTGNNIEDEIRTRIVEPLGLRSTELAVHGFEAADVNGAWMSGDNGLEYIGNASPSALLSAFGSAAGIVSRPVEMSKFIRALHTGELISSNSLNSMKTILPGSSKDSFLGYGLGTQSIDVHGYQVYGHKGNLFHHSSTFYSPDLQISISFVMNHSNNYALDNVFYGLFEKVVDHLATGPTISLARNDQMTLSIYPNPASTNFTVEFLNPENDPYRFMVLDITGKKTWLSGTTRENRVDLNLDGLPYGFYIVRLIGEELLQGILIVE